MPDDWPDYPHHSQLLAYLERYADHFGLRRHIWFGTEVVRVEPADGRPLGRDHPQHRRRRLRAHPAVRGRGGRQRAQLVAEAAAATRAWTSSAAQVIHARRYKDAGAAARAQVLVVGAGNTGCDIAVEAAQQASQVLALHPARLLVRARSTSSAAPPTRSTT